MAGGKHNHHWFFRGKKREFGTFNLTTMVMSGSAFFAMTNRRQSKLKGDKVVWGGKKSMEMATSLREFGYFFQEDSVTSKR